MTEFDINYEGYTPKEPTRQEPYRPPVDPTPYRPPQDPEVFQQPDDPGLDDYTPYQERDKQKQRKEERAPRQRDDAEREREHQRELERKREREAAAKERKLERERRIKELRKERSGNRRSLAIVRFFTDDRMRLFIGLTLTFVSVFVLMAIFSHFNSGAHDQSLTTNLTTQEIAAQPGSVNNAAGPVGAKLSQLMICDWLGLGSVVFIIYLWILALGLLKIRKCNFWGTTFRCLLLAITVSIVLGLITYDSPTVIYWGGNHGHYINKWLIDNTTILGAIGVSLLLIAAICCVYLNELRIVYKKWRAAYQRHKIQDELRKERRRELERLEAEEAEEARRVEAAEKAKAAEEKRKAQEVKKAQEAARKAAEAAKKAENMSTEGGTTISINIDKPADAVSTKPVDQTLIIDPYHDKHNTSEDDNVLIIDPEEFESQKGQTTQVDEKFTIVAPEIEEADHIDNPNTNDSLYDHRANLSSYEMPPIDLLEERPSGPVIDMEEQQANKALIEKTLLDYKIPISKIEATVGPTVTLYEIVPAEGVRISQIKRLEDDIALSLKALGIRIIAPIPGKGTVGIEVPNNDPQTVSMRSVINSKKYQECKMALPMAMGATISNDIFIADMAKMPHLLVAGATGMGKSVGLNAIIASLLYKKHPSELKFVLVDPKMVEFSLYSKLEHHYLAKLPNEEEAIITDMKKVIQTLNSLCVEMDDRYELLRDANVRSLEEYNKKFTERRLSPDLGHRYLPYIVVIVDEFADLIMTQGKEVEQPIARIAQKARAVGIHMILATQRPSTNVITGLIKANFPGRIAFRVIQMVDSRTILDCPGANQLIGRGDMLFSHNGIMERVQCAFISTEEVEKLTEYIDHQIGYEHAYYLPEFVPEEAEGAGAIAGGSMERDSLFNEAARFVVSRQMGSTSSLQRQFGIGYNRAGKLMDQMEAAGIVGPVNGAKPRSILMDIVTLESILGD